MVRAGLNSMLRKQSGLRIVGTVHGGREALEFLAKEPADVMLLDLRMPNMDGIDTLRALRKLVSPPKVVILSNFELDEEIYRAVEAGAMGYLGKTHRGTKSSPPSKPCTREILIFPNASKSACWSGSSATG